MSEVQLAYRKVVSQIEQLALKYGKKTPNLVAVSKTKPSSMIVEVYKEGHRHFGENYVQELVEKSADPLLLSEAPDVKWHFIGHLQSNKAKSLVKDTPNLWMVESLDSEKLAKFLQNGCESIQRQNLKVLIQVNTTDEAQKGGVSANIEEIMSLVNYIRSHCPNLEFCGLMTVGKVGDVSPIYFEKLSRLRNEVASRLGVNPGSLELSMGMTDDLELAIQADTTTVRIGSAIFGTRNYATKS